jgi:hypothetical protein
MGQADKMSICPPTKEKQMNNSISIGSSAMLVELSIRSWTGRKLDKKVSAEVDSAKNTKTSVVNANKNLMAGTGVLDKIIKYAAGARAWHVSRTLPWSDNGSRLLPMSNFMAYKEHLTKMEEEYNALVDKFVDSYPNLILAAAFQLGDLFDRTEYPEIHTLKQRFAFSCNFFPVPTAGDFRIDINEEAKAEIIANCEQAYNNRLENAMHDAWERLKDCLTRMSDRLVIDVVHGEDGTPSHEFRVFRDSLVDNAKELTDLLKHLNLTKDPMMEQARRDLEHVLIKYDAETLRESFTARTDAKAQVDAILNKMSF